MANIYQPTLVIGLGGTGKKVILSLKRMIAENSEHGLSDFPFLKLLSFDTDNAVDNEKSDIKTLSSSDLTLNKEKEIFELKTDFSSSINLDDYPKIKDWFPDSLQSTLQPSNLSRGAGQKKPIGRFTFAWNAGRIYQALKGFLSSPVDAKEAKSRNVAKNLSKTINVFIVGSICGGTGAGTFLDMAYLVRYIANTNSGSGYKIELFGLLALATLFNNIQGAGNVKLNCYASLVELDHFMNNINNQNPNRIFYPVYRNWEPDYSNCAMTAPFDYPFLFDNNGDGLSLDTASFTQMCARFIYLLTGNELSKSWMSMDNNVAPNLERTYKKDIYNKSIQYRSMGTFSILYPRRIVIQLCAYNLFNNFLDMSLKDDYAPNEIDMLAKAFLKDIGLSIEEGELEEVFDPPKDYNGPGNGKMSFSVYLDDTIEDTKDNPIEKNSIVSDLDKLKGDLDKQILRFKDNNSNLPGEVRKRFLSQLELKLHTLLSLHETKLGVKKVNGELIPDRGSLVRTQKFVQSLMVMFDSYLTTVKNKRSGSETNIKNTEDNFNEALEDLASTARSFISTKKKRESVRDKVLDACRDYILAKKEELVLGWIIELLTDILWNNMPKDDGIIKELSKYNDRYSKALISFKDMKEDVADYLEKNRRFDSNNFFDIVFDYNIDVVRTCDTTIVGNEELIYGTVSDSLMDPKCFGATYENVVNRTTASMSVDILKEAEKPFFDTINKVNISERLLLDESIKSRLESGQYYGLTGIYLNVDKGGVLSKCGLDFNNSTYFSVSIPDDYQGKPCKDDVAGDVRDKICPLDSNPEKYPQGSCALYGKCVKQMLLKNKPTNIAIVPSDNMSEINFMNTIAGFPLCAITSVMSDCKADYTKQKRKQAEENSHSGKKEECINMFGPIHFDDLDEYSSDPSKELEGFRKLLVLAWVSGRLKIQKLSVDFHTNKDRQTGNRDKFSLHLGMNIASALNLYQSSKIADQNIVGLFIRDMKKLEANLKGNQDGNNTEASKANQSKKDVEKLKNRFKDLYTKPLPEGFDDIERGDSEYKNDRDLLRDLAWELCELKLENTSDADSDLNF